MLLDMRMQVEVRLEDEDKLRRIAAHEHRAVRDQLEFYVHHGIAQDWTRLEQSEPAEVEAV